MRGTFAARLIAVYRARKEHAVRYMGNLVWDFIGERLGLRNELSSIMVERGLAYITGDFWERERQKEIEERERDIVRRVEKHKRLDVSKGDEDMLEHVAKF